MRMKLLHGLLTASLLTLITGCAEDGLGDAGRAPARSGGMLEPDTPPAGGATSLSPGAGGGIGAGSDVGAGSPNVGSGEKSNDVSGAGSPSGGIENDTGANGAKSSKADLPSSANGTLPPGSGGAQGKPAGSGSDPGGSPGAATPPK